MPAVKHDRESEGKQSDASAECFNALMVTRVHISASSTCTRMEEGEPGVTDRSWHGVNSFNDGRHDSVCVCVRV